MHVCMPFARRTVGGGSEPVQDVCIAQYHLRKLKEKCASLGSFEVKASTF